MKKLLFILILLSNFCWAQNAKELTFSIDSLNSIINNDNTHDTLKLKALDKISFLYYKTKQYDKEKEITLKNIDLAKKIGDKKSEGFGYYSLASIYERFENPYEAITSYNKAVSLFEETQNSRMIPLTYHYIANLYNQQNFTSKAIEFYNKALSIQIKLDDKYGVGQLYSKLAKVYEDDNDLSSALKFYNKALEVSKEIKENYPIAFCYNSIGNIYVEKKQYDKAFQYFTKGKEISEKDTILSTMVKSYNNLGNLYHKKGNYTKSLEYYQKTTTIINNGKDDRQLDLPINERSNLYKQLTALYLDMDLDAKAKTSAEFGLQMAQDKGYPFLIRDHAALLAKILLKVGDYKRAYEIRDLEIIMKDSMLNIENQKKIAEQQFKNDYEKQKTLDDLENNKLLAIEKEGKSKQKIISISVSIGLGLVAIFLFFVFNRLRITKKQKLIIEEQKIEVEHAHYELGEKNQEIMDSISYAKRIQSAILPPNKIVKEYLKESFILYKPKDIVAGDFYWIEPLKNGVLYAAADCTGHGVPGAMVSVICNNALNRSVREYGLTDPGQILDKTREIVIEEFEKSEEEVKDGMDIALCALIGNKIQYAGANNPLWIIRDGEIIETKANKQPIGKYTEPKPFTTQTFELQEGDSIYIFSDGYVDQFGGERGKKFKSKAFRTLLLSIQDKPLENQRVIIDETFENWKGNLEQIDDVCVIGVRL